VYSIAFDSRFWKGIYWDYLTKEKIDAIPYSKQLRSSSIRRSP